MEKPTQTVMDDDGENLMLMRGDSSRIVEMVKVAEEALLDDVEFGETKSLIIDRFSTEEANITPEVGKKHDIIIYQNPAEVQIAVIVKTEPDLEDNLEVEAIVQVEKMALDIVAGDGRKLKEESFQIVVTEEQLSLLTEGRETYGLSANRNVAVRGFEPIDLKKMNGVSVPEPWRNLIFDWLQKQEFSVLENVDLLNSTVKLGDGNRNEVFSLIAEVLWREQERGVPGRMRRGVKMKWPKKWLEIGPISKLGGVSCRSRITLSNNILFWSLCR
jgi:hypothetical protein